MPTSTLFYLPVIVSVIGAAIIQFAFQLYLFLNITRQPFYVEPITIGEDEIYGGNIMSYEDSVLFMVSCF